MNLPIGFKISGLRAGIYKKPDKLDMALFYSERPALAAGMFTLNEVKAAPILVSQKHVRAARVRAIIANSGCANACTGARGLKDAQTMCDWTAQALGLQTENILVASTGVIGQFLPMAKIKSGIAGLQKSLTQKPNPLTAVQAIMTTDTFPKWVSRQFKISGKTVTIWGCAKGSGMIHPNMGTMFAFLLTDAPLPAAKIKSLLKDAVDPTFNALTVDGDTSTNDCVFLLANGASAKVESGAELKKFAAELNAVCLELAKKMAADGEGATVQIEVSVEGAANKSNAKKIAQTVATSPLVKTAFFGKDANWGRVMAAVGRAGVKLDPSKIEICFGPVRVAKNGCAAAFSEARAKKVLSQKIVPLKINLHQGKFGAQYFTCDYSLDYVRINADYRS